MKIEDIMFSVNQYDSQGDIWEEGIYLHIGDICITIGDYNNLNKFIAKLENIKKEYADTYLHNAF